MTTAGRTVLFSGLTVAAAMASLLIFPQAFLKSMGYGGMAAVLVAMLAALTILPATLRLLGRRIDAGRLPWRRHQPVAVGDDHGRWAALAHARDAPPGGRGRGDHRRLLLLVASPFLGAKWGSVDYRVLPPGRRRRTSRPTSSTRTSAPSVRAPACSSTGADEQAVSAYTRDVEAVDGVLGRAAGRDRGRRHAAAGHLGRQQPDRGVAGPASRTCARSTRRSGEVLVGGMTADTVDLIDSVGEHLPVDGRDRASA